MSDRAFYLFGMILMNVGIVVGMCVEPDDPDYLLRLQSDTWSRISFLFGCFFVSMITIVLLRDFWKNRPKAMDVTYSLILLFTSTLLMLVVSIGIGVYLSKHPFPPPSPWVWRFF